MYWPSPDECEVSRCCENGEGVYIRHRRSSPSPHSEMNFDMEITDDPKESNVEEIIRPSECGSPEVTLEGRQQWRLSETVGLTWVPQNRGNTTDVTPEFKSYGKICLNVTNIITM